MLVLFSKEKKKLKKLAITKDNNETNQSLGGGLLNSSIRNQLTLDFGTIIKTSTRSTKWTKYSNFSLFAVKFVSQGVCASEERILT